MCAGEGKRAAGRRRRSSSGGPRALRTARGCWRRTLLTGWSQLTASTLTTYERARAVPHRQRWQPGGRCIPACFALLLPRGAQEGQSPSTPHFVRTCAILCSGARAPTCLVSFELRSQQVKSVFLHEAEKAFRKARLAHHRKAAPLGRQTRLTRCIPHAPHVHRSSASPPAPCPRDVKWSTLSSTSSASDGVLLLGLRVTPPTPLLPSWCPSSRLAVVLQQLDTAALPQLQRPALGISTRVLPPAPQCPSFCCSPAMTCVHKWRAWCNGFSACERASAEADMPDCAKAKAHLLERGRVGRDLLLALVVEHWRDGRDRQACARIDGEVRRRGHAIATSARARAPHPSQRWVWEEEHIVARAQRCCGEPAESLVPLAPVPYMPSAHTSTGSLYTARVNASHSAMEAD